MLLGFSSVSWGATAYLNLPGTGTTPSSWTASAGTVGSNAGDTAGIASGSAVAATFTSSGSTYTLDSDVYFDVTALGADDYTIGTTAETIDLAGHTFTVNVIFGQTVTFSAKLVNALLGTSGGLNVTGGGDVLFDSSNGQYASGMDIGSLNLDSSLAVLPINVSWGFLNNGAGRSLSSVNLQNGSTLILNDGAQVGTAGSSVSFLQSGAIQMENGGGTASVTPNFSNTADILYVDTNGGTLAIHGNQISGVAGNAIELQVLDTTASIGTLNLYGNQGSVAGGNDFAASSLSVSSGTVNLLLDTVDQSLTNINATGGTVTGSASALDVFLSGSSKVTATNFLFSTLTMSETSTLSGVVGVSGDINLSGSAVYGAGSPGLNTNGGTNLFANTGTPEFVALYDGTNSSLVTTGGSALLNAQFELLLSAGNYPAGTQTLTVLTAATPGSAPTRAPKWNIAGVYTDAGLTVPATGGEIALSLAQDGNNTNLVLTINTPLYVSATTTPNYVAADFAPAVATSGGSAAFVEGSGVASTPVTVDSGLTVSDSDTTTLASATVSITGNLQASEDVLAFTNDGSSMGNVAASYDAPSGVLSLTSAGSTATLAQWQAALRSVTYTNSSNTPSTSTRTVSFVVNDGARESDAASRNVTVTSSNDAPTDIALSNASATQSSGANATIGTLSSTDSDSSSFTYTLVSGTGSTDNASFNISGSTLRANDASALAGGSYSVRIQTDDGSGGTFAKAFTITIVDNVAPVITSGATAGGTYNSVFGGYTVTASGGATSFGASGLPTGLTINTGTGAITGTPTQTGTFTVSLSATDAASNTGTGSLTLTVSKATATVTFNSLEATFDNSAHAVTATTVPSGLTLSYTYDGSSTAPTNAGHYAVVATVNDTNYAGSASGTLNIAKASQTIAFETPADHAAGDAPVSLSATASSGLAVTFTLVSGPAHLSGSTVTLTGDQGTVVVRASQAGNANYDPATDVTRSFQVTSTLVSVFFGDILNASSSKVGDFAAALPPGANHFTLLLASSSLSKDLALDVPLANDGSFTTTVSSGALGSVAALKAGTDVKPVLSGSLTIHGQLLDGTITGQIDELSLTFTTTVQPHTGPTAALAGLYISPSVNSNAGTTTAIVGPQNQILVVTTSAAVTAGGLGTVGTDGVFTITVSGGTISGTIDPAKLTIVGSVAITGLPTVTFQGLGSTTERNDRLVNISSRALVGSSLGRGLITGFVITGDAPKRVLLRVVGPGLGVFHVDGLLANPGLRLYDSTNAVVLENDDWSGDETAAAFGQVGAFGLEAGSKDAAIVTTLQPGSYTMHILDGGSTGIAIAEVYDASANPQAESQHLLNLSSRGTVDAGDGVLIGGFVVTGNSPKKVLIRGIGPSLGVFNVTDALTDSRLAIYSNEKVLIAQNDDWGTPVAVGNSQVAGTASEIDAAAHATGAFVLESGTKDAAVLITLAPGAYTAQVSSATGQPGEALVETYEVP